MWVRYFAWSCKRWVEFQWAPLKFHMKYLTQSSFFIQYWNFKSSQIYDLVWVFETPPELVHQGACRHPNTVLNHQQAQRWLHNVWDVFVKFSVISNNIRHHSKWPIRWDPVRNLDTSNVDLQQCCRLCPLLPASHGSRNHIRKSGWTQTLEV